MPKLLRLLLRMLMPSIVDGEGGGAPMPDAPAPMADAAPAPDAAPVADAAPAEPQPTSMHDAMWLRDEQGRFVGKAPAAPAATGTAPAAPAAPVAAAPGKAPAVPGAPKSEEDLTAMPDGLGAKAQERFQKLATVNRELTERTQMLDQQVSYVRDTFQQHGVRQDQFEQAVSVIGAMNRGDYATAQKVLTEQLRQVALMSGQPLEGLDPLQEFPDLRQRVDALQMTEADAIELGRLRKTQSMLQGQRQQAEQAQQSQQAERQAFEQGQAGVDSWVKDMASKDIDWPVIEEQLLPDVQNLLKGVPPSAWVNVLQAQYNVLKRAAGAFRRTPTPQGGSEPAPLRPMGAGATQRAPQSMHEAMWGSSPRA